MKISVCVQCLHCYNAGLLKFEWLDLPVDDIGEEIERFMREHINRIPAGYNYLLNEPHEEWHIADYECEGVSLPEYSSLSELRALNELAELDEDEAQKVLYIFDQNGGQNLRKALDEGLDRLTFYPDQTLEDLAGEFLEMKIEALKSFIEQHAYDSFMKKSLLDILADLEMRYDVDGLASDLDIEGYDERPEGVYRWE